MIATMHLSKIWIWSWFSPLILAYPTDETLQTSIDPNSISSTIRDTLRENDIIGDVLDDFEPLYNLDIVYPKHHESVLLGNDIPVKAVQDRPAFTFHPLHSLLDKTNESVFTIALTDPDAKSRQNPKWSEMCHWIMTNLTTPVSYPLSTAVAQSGELIEYKPPGPPPRTGAHRYVFVLLEGTNSQLSRPRQRQHWGYEKVRHGVRDWAAENDLRIVGANFFFAQNKKQ